VGVLERNRQDNKRQGRTCECMRGWRKKENVEKKTCVCVCVCVCVWERKRESERRES
jgi:hypothetical protein